MRGWIPVWRQLFRREHWLAPSKRHPACRGWAWIDILQLAQHDTYEHAGQTLKRGEFVASYDYLAERWCWSRMQVRRFLERLQADTSIVTLTDTPLGKVYRVVNYDRYSADSMINRHPERHPDRHSTDTLPTPEQEGNTENPPAVERQDKKEGEGIETLPAAAQSAIRGLYGWEGRPGTQDRIWGDITDWEERKRILETAVLRLVGEGHEYRGNFFRGILRRVIAEETQKPHTYDETRTDSDFEELYG